MASIKSSEIRLPVWFLTHRSGRMPIFLDKKNRTWFFVFSEPAKADAWLPRAEPGSVLLKVERLKPITDFVRRNKGAGLVFNPVSGGKCDGMLSLDEAEGKAPPAVSRTVPVGPDQSGSDHPTLVLPDGAALFLKRAQEGMFAAGTAGGKGAKPAAAKPAPGAAAAPAPTRVVTDAREVEEEIRHASSVDDDWGSALPKVPGYELLGELGRGGMGVVYKARQLGLDRMVALKMVRRKGNEAAAAAGFRAEAEAVARLNHPNHVQIYEVGEHEGMPFFSMEFVDGGSLASKISGVPVPYERAAAWIQVLALAMRYAHARNLVHRDLKPANVLMTADGVMKIADFGLAKRLDDGDRGSKGIVGTPAYMAPEQLADDTSGICPATDIYALGTILYQMVVGQPPFVGGTTMEVFYKVHSAEPTPPSHLRPDLPRDLEAIIMKCLEKDPSRRYPDGAALAEDLGAFLAGEPIKARPLGRPERLWRWCRRNPGPVGLLAAVTLASGVGLWLMSALPDKLMRSAALRSCAQECEMLDAVNSLYTDVVINPVKSRGGEIRHDFEKVPGAIPIPATMTIHLGRRISALSKTGMEVRLYSAYPFTSRKDGGPRDDFERYALQQLNQTPDEPVYRFEERDGKLALRYAISRKMVRQACVDCHNSHPESTKTDWVLGQVRGALELIRPLDNDAELARAGLQDTFALMGAIGGGLLLVTGAVVVLGARRRRPPAAAADAPAA